jgi:hypothetical protein
MSDENIKKLLRKFYHTLPTNMYKDLRILKAKEMVLSVVEVLYIDLSDEITEKLKTIDGEGFI